MDLVSSVFFTSAFAMFSEVIASFRWHIRIAIFFIFCIVHLYDQALCVCLTTAAQSTFLGSI